MGARDLILIVLAASTVHAQEPAPLDAGAAERVESVRALLTVRLDPKLGAAPGECERLAAADLAVYDDAGPARVVAVERVPPPDRHWLVIDISASAEGARREAKRSAARYVREILGSDRRRASLLTVDDDLRLVEGPTSDAALLASRVEEIPAGGSSLLIDGIEDVLRQIEGDRREHLVVFWSDGHDSGSWTSTSEILDRIRKTSNATIVPLAITIGAGGPSRPASPWLFDVADRSGGEVYGSHDPAWLGRIRGWLDRRFVVTVRPGEEASGRWTVRVRAKRCDAVLVHDAFHESPPPIVNGPPRSWTRAIERSKASGHDPACGKQGWERPWIARGTRLEACVVDLLVDRGMLALPAGATFTAPPPIGVRAVAVDVPPFERLAASPEGMFARLAELVRDESAGRSSRLVDGRTLFTQQAAIARALYAAYPEYRAFAKRRLEREARDEIEAVARTLREDLVGLDVDTSRRLARDGRRGRAVTAAATTPTDADLRRVLGAWLGDVAAVDLFRGWERTLVAARLAGGSGDPLPAWRRLRSWFALPSAARILTPLLPVHDAERDLVGFYRVLLPRASGITQREQVARGEPPPYDLVPERPYALGYFDALVAEHPLLAERLRAAHCAVDDLGYEPVDVWKQTVEHPWHALRLRIGFACAPSPIAPDGFVALQAELSVGKDETVAIVRGSDVKALLGGAP